MAEFVFVDKLVLNVSFADGDMSASLESDMNRFAKGPLSALLDEVLSEFSCSCKNDNIEIDHLNLDLGNVTFSGSFEEILKKLKSGLKPVLEREIDLQRVTPTIKALSNIYHSFLPKLNASDLESRFQKCAEDLLVGQKASSEKFLRIAEKIILDMQKDFPFLDSQQIACITYNKLTSLQKKMEKKMDDVATERIPVFDAGLVLLCPYLAKLFELLHYTENNCFINEEKRVRCAVLLRFLVSADFVEDGSLPCLAKLFCDIPLDEVLPSQSLLSEEEKSVADKLLASAISNWAALGRTSVEGFRSAFLHRKGFLMSKESDYYLQVPVEAFDVLLDRLPWGYSTLGMPWRKGLIFTKWR